MRGLRVRRWIYAALLAGACTPGRGAEDTIAITGVTVIDGTGTAARTGQTVVVRGSRIAAVGPDAAVRIPAGARRMDGRGRWLIPGLWDMHAASAGADFIKFARR